MITPLVNETQRLEAVKRFLNLEISYERELQDIVTLAASLCEAPIALITVMDKDIQYFKFKAGTEVTQTSRQDSFCTHFIDQREVTVVADLKQDIRFTNNPIVNSEHAVRFYAGAPLTTHEGANIGSLCVLDVQPKELNPHQKSMLAILSRQVINVLEFELSVAILKEQYAEAMNLANKLRSFVDSSPGCHVLMGRDLKVITFNKAFHNFIYKLYHIDLEPGMMPTEFMDRAYIGSFLRSFKRALNGESFTVECLLKYPDVNDVWWQLIYNPAYDGDGNIIGISCNATNINERKQHEQKIIEQNNILRRIAYVQSHEFRKPVASILGLLSVMKLEGSADREDCLRMIEQAAHELDSTIRNIVQSAEPMIAGGDNASLDSYLSLAG